MPRLIILMGRMFGGWTVLSRATSSHGASRWKCRCECGNLRVVYSAGLLRGTSKSCGCRHAKMAAIVMSRTMFRHGYTGTSTHRTWLSMIARCTGRYSTSYKDYGGRGIVVCARWLKFENFLADMGEKPEHLLLDRINNDGNYEPKNCRWTTRHEQNRNKRNNVWIEHNEKRMVEADWAMNFGMTHSNLRRELRRRSFADVFKSRTLKMNAEFLDKQYKK